MYGKIFQSTFTGSLFGSGPTVFSVWSYVIANAYEDHVELNPKLIAACIGTTPEDISKAIAFLCAPDSNSRSSESGGIRLVHEYAFQYTVPNWQKYHGTRNERDRREYMRGYMQKKRAGNVDDVSQLADDVSQLADTVSHQTDVSHVSLAHTDTDADTDTKTYANGNGHDHPPPPADEYELNGADERKPRTRSKHAAKSRLNEKAFAAFWDAYPKKSDKVRAQKEFAVVDPDVRTLAAMLAAIERGKLTKEWRDRQFIPNPSTWLHNRRWEDELDTSLVTGHSNSIAGSQFVA